MREQGSSCGYLLPLTESSVLFQRFRDKLQEAHARQNYAGINEIIAWKLTNEAQVDAFNLLSVFLAKHAIVVAEV